MKSIKTILAVILITTFFASCTPTSLEDEDTTSEVYSSGGEHQTEVDNVRD